MLKSAVYLTSKFLLSPDFYGELKGRRFNVCHAGYTLTNNMCKAQIPYSDTKNVKTTLQKHLNNYICSCPIEWYF